MSEELKAAQARIACLEGEIAKRDARIVELERYQFAFNEWHDKTEWVQAESATLSAKYLGCHRADVMRSLIDGLRAELAAIKAQEPVAEVKHSPLDSSGWPEFVRVKTIGDFDLENLPNGMKLYAAPVSEAKAQGVVQWPEADEIMQMAFEEGQPADDASGYCFELEEFDLFIERLMSEVARLNAAPAQHPDDDAVDRFAVAMKVKLAASREKGRHGWQNATGPHLSSLLNEHMFKGDPLDVGNLAMMLHQNGQAIELPHDARRVTAPVQQVSVPDGKVCVPVEVLRLYEFMAASFTPLTSQHEQIAISLRKAKAAMLAAPAAPAADAGGEE